MGIRRLFLQLKPYIHLTEPLNCCIVTQSNLLVLLSRPLLCWDLSSLRGSSVTSDLVCAAGMPELIIELTLCAGSTPAWCSVCSSPAFENADTALRNVVTQNSQTLCEAWKKENSDSVLGFLFSSSFHGLCQFLCCDHLCVVPMKKKDEHFFLN